MINSNLRSLKQSVDWYMLRKILGILGTAASSAVDSDRILGILVPLASNAADSDRQVNLHLII